jgi:zinc/manganese transport system permease protein
MLEILAAPFVICLILTGIHCYLGLHVVTRGVIFVDLSLAQVAALGTTLALLAGYELGSSEAYISSLTLTFVGAGVFAITRMKKEKIPQEAIIGIVFAVSSAASILVLDRAPHGHEAIKAMLVGNVLYVTWQNVLETFLIYLVIGAFHYLLRDKFLLISTDIKSAQARGMAIQFWDFLFYVTFGFVVTSSVKVAGVLLVFSYLVVPAACAMLFTDRIGKRLLIGWGIGFITSVFGLYFSATYDLPTGASIVTVFGLVLILSAIIRSVGLKLKRT